MVFMTGYFETCEIPLQIEVLGHTERDAMRLKYYTLHTGNTALIIRVKE